jgi:5'-nucleotidase
MRVLVTNDDGIFAEGLWALVRGLKKVAQVIVVAPIREQSAVGTAVTLSQPLRVQKVPLMVPEVETYSVEGTPSDCVILALEKLIEDKVDLVVSGINHGLNLGDDVLISGTVSAALQGYLRGFPALAISVATMNSLQLDNAAKLATLLAEKVVSRALPSNILLNINLPGLPLSKIKGVQLTQLASKSHINTVEEGNDGRRQYYWLVRQQTDRVADNQTDIWVVEQGNISITPLHTSLLNRPAPAIPSDLCAHLLRGLRQHQRLHCSVDN